MEQPALPGLQPKAISVRFQGDEPMMLAALARQSGLKVAKLVRLATQKQIPIWLREGIKFPPLDRQGTLVGPLPKARAAPRPASKPKPGKRKR